MNNTIKKNYSSYLKANITEEAGSMADYDCFAETVVLFEVFRQKGIDITLEEARGPIGIDIRDHIRVLTKYPRIAEEWLEEIGRECTEADIEKMFNNFISLQLSVIREQVIEVPDLPGALSAAHLQRMQSGLVTGYNC